MSRKDIKLALKANHPAGQKYVEVSQEELDRISGGGLDDNDPCMGTVCRIITTVIVTTAAEGCGMKSSWATPCKRC
ncbi:hypothetical protein J2Z48_002141 [Croceifilum oryzae]|uniref:Uncharacterized protein n=1 Tax=Croceifilum oryzae TaxID=1553429 RepID=A0AAJ1WQW6_9BACL|nr:hypothetical protein [Croceifilum oryzae]MDQ0417957.1 hypothetical protein [Croceifilum oryzae]